MDQLTYHNKLVRDLCWLINESSLIDHSTFSRVVPEAYVKELAQEFMEILINSVELREVLAGFMQDCPNYIIGKYAEQLMAFFITEHPRLELMMHNFQVIEDGRTLSEIDFIFRDLKTAQVHHWELSYKFYLQYNEQWIGPNARDTLAQKLERVEAKQFPIIQHGSVKELIPEPINSNLYLKAYLFLECTQDNLSHPSLWVKEPNLIGISGKQHYWCVLPKNYWFSQAVLAPKELVILRWPEIIKLCGQHIREENKSILIARLSKQNGDYYEDQRIFVVPNAWPQLDSD